ncbi:MAG: cell division topological specificity factor MinE [Desulfobacterales bacterium]|nr:cell division topological specificity factor MinE [Desulfobacterales bacterium]
MLSEMFRKFKGGGKSKEIAKKRLQVTLVCDKLGIDEATLTALQNDIVEVISRYFEIDQNGLKLDIKRTEDSASLAFNSLIMGAKNLKKNNAEQNKRK